ncbi:MAG: hypothetical protein NUW37_12295 [Planctomycetes bacterium]|nr:hypothetical protein [Planctomycetota bacterium]
MRTTNYELRIENFFLPRRGEAGGAAISILVSIALALIALFSLRALSEEPRGESRFRLVIYDESDPLKIRIVIEGTRVADAGRNVKRIDGPKVTLKNVRDTADQKFGGAILNSSYALLDETARTIDFRESVELDVFKPEGESSWLKLTTSKLVVEWFTSPSGERSEKFTAPEGVVIEGESVHIEGSNVDGSLSPKQLRIERLTRFDLDLQTMPVILPESKRDESWAVRGSNFIASLATSGPIVIREDARQNANDLPRTRFSFEGLTEIEIDRAAGSEEERRDAINESSPHGRRSDVTRATWDCETLEFVFDTPRKRITSFDIPGAFRTEMWSGSPETISFGTGMRADTKFAQSEQNEIATTSSSFHGALWHRAEPMFEANQEADEGSLLGYFVSEAYWNLETTEDRTNQVLRIEGDARADPLELFADEPPPVIGTGALIESTEDETVRVPAITAKTARLSTIERTTTMMLEGDPCRVRYRGQSFSSDRATYRTSDLESAVTIKAPYRMTVDTSIPDLRSDVSERLNRPMNERKYLSARLSVTLRDDLTLSNSTAGFGEVAFAIPREDFSIEILEEGAAFDTSEIESLNVRLSRETEPGAAAWKIDDLEFIGSFSVDDPGSFRISFENSVSFSQRRGSRAQVLYADGPLRVFIPRDRARRESSPSGN